MAENNENDTLGGTQSSFTPPPSPLSQGQPPASQTPPTQGQTPPASTTQPPAAQPKANVRLASSQEELALPKGTCNIGMSSIEIPDKAQQLAGFYAEDPGLLVGQFRQFKFIQEKGQANDQSISL